VRKREVLGAALVAVVAGALVVASVVGAEDGAAPAATAPQSATAAPLRAAVMTVAATTSTSTTTTTTTTTAPVVVTTPPPAAPTVPATTVPATSPPATAPAAGGPAPPPANPRESVAVNQIGWIDIAAIGLNHPMYEGVSLTVLDVGPGHWPGTPMPGGGGNVVLGGHRVTNSHPFRDLDLLHAGDLIRFDMLDGSRHTYSVTEQFIVDPEVGMWIVDPTSESIVTLFACHPKGSARERIVIRAALVG
jgi:sortase A